MRILTEAWEYRAVIGLVILILVACFGWQRLKRAMASAERSNRKFQAEAKAVLTEDLPWLGIEASVPSDLHKK